MERAGPEVSPKVAHEPRNSLLHLTRRLIGEGDGDDVVRAYVSLADEVGNPLRQRIRLAGSRAGEDQNGALVIKNRLLLRLVQTGEKGGFVSGIGDLCLGDILR